MNHDELRKRAQVMMLNPAYDFAPIRPGKVLDLLDEIDKLYEALRQLERVFAVGAEGYRAAADREDALRSARAALRAARGEEA